MKRKEMSVFVSGNESLIKCDKYGTIKLLYDCLCCGSSLGFNLETKKPICKVKEK